MYVEERSSIPRKLPYSPNSVKEEDAEQSKVIEWPKRILSITTTPSTPLKPSKKL